MRIEALLFTAHVGLYGFKSACAKYGGVTRYTGFYRVAEIEQEVLGFRLFDRTHSCRSESSWQPANTFAVTWLTAAAQVLRQCNELDAICQSFKQAGTWQPIRNRLTDSDVFALFEQQAPENSGHKRRIEAWLGFRVWVGAAHTDDYQAVEGYVRDTCNSLSRLRLLTRRLRERVGLPP